MDTESTGQDTGEKQLDLMGRAAQLFEELQGPRWSEIADSLEKEGYLEDGRPVSSNALRKRFQKDPVLRKVLSDYRQGKSGKEKTPEFRVRKQNLDSVAAQSMGRIKRTKKPDHTSYTTVTAKEVLDLLQGSIQRRDEMLLEQIRKSNTDSDTGIMRQIEDKIMEKLKTVEEQLQEAEERLAILVEDKVDEALRSMVKPGSAFAKDIESLLADIMETPERSLANNMESLVTKVIETKMSSGVWSLLSVLPQLPGQGPGRWEGEGKMARFSATMPQHLYDAMKELKDDMSFSARIAAACDVYLRVLASQKGSTE